MKSIARKITPMIITCLCAGLVLTVLAPLGTHRFSTFPRLAYWVGLCVAGGIGASTTNVIALWLKKDLSPWVSAFFQSITASIAVALVIVLVTFFAFSNMPAAKHFLFILFYIWVISITITSIGALIRQRAATSDTLSDTISDRAALYERLPPKLRNADIYALAAEDHYVRVITSKGDDLILMRLSDAIKETTPLIGLSPHRSWWVAEIGVDTIKKTELVLHTNQTVPISRNGMKLVREAGWV